MLPSLRQQTWTNHPPNHRSGRGHRTSDPPGSCPTELRFRGSPRVSRDRSPSTKSGRRVQSAIGKCQLDMMSVFCSIPSCSGLFLDTLKVRPRPGLAQWRTLAIWRNAAQEVRGGQRFPLTTLIGASGGAHCSIPHARRSPKRIYCPKGFQEFLLLLSKLCPK